jgi:hypothetical protein
LKNDICRNWLDETTFANLITSTSFKYFAVNGNTLFAVNELPISVNNGQFFVRVSFVEGSGKLFLG